MPRRRGGPRLVTRKGKSSYFIRFIDKEGRQRDRSTGTSVHSAAEEVLLKFLEERKYSNQSSQNGPPKPKELHEMLIAEALLKYANSIGDRESAAARLSYAMKPLLDFWNENPVSFINLDACKDYLKFRRKTRIRRTTVRRELSCLRAALNHCVSTRTLVPFPKMTLPSLGKPKIRWLRKREAIALIKSARKEYRSKFHLTLFISIALHTGARKSAILELEWNQIDFENRMINFNKSNDSNYEHPSKLTEDDEDYDDDDDVYDDDDDDDEYLSKQKPRANVPMNDMLYGHLKRRFDKYGAESQFVFHQKGNPSRKIEDVRKGFESACRRAKLKRVTIHTLRHTAITWAILRGENRTLLSKYVNISLATMDKVYSHFDKKDLKEFAGRM
jgi:integrase